MTTTAPAPAAPTGRTAPATGRSGALVGTGGLVRVALRFDRWRILVWSLAVAGLTFASVDAIAGLYGGDDSRAARALLVSSPAATALAGPGYGLDDYTVGAMTANELGLWVMLPVAILALLTVTRHLRAAEEDGRLELVRSGPVGRDAPVVAGLVAAVVATLAVSGLTFLALLGTDVDPVGSAALCAGIAMVGLVFAGVSAVASQVTAHGRTASGLGMAVLGVAFVLRAVGDVRGPQGTSVLTWLSPFGWAQATRAYVDERWWPLLIGVVAAGACVALAFWLAARRDLGTGLVAERLGPPHASRALSGMVGLTLRRQWGSIVSWGSAVVLMAALVGVLAGAIVDFVEDEATLGAIFGGEDPTAGAFSLYVVFLAVTTAAYTVTAVGAVRAEEVATRGARVLAGPVTRSRWLGAQVGVAAVTAVVVTLLSGLVMGATAAASLSEPDRVASLLGANAATLPATACVLALAVLVYGVAPRFLGLVWAYVAYVAVVGMFGQILPDGSDVASPFTYLPALPREEMQWPPVLAVSAVAVALAAAGFVFFRRRDVAG
ncbi:ABC transporter permease [Cellulomonas fimi]|uniref:Anibiotic ABC transporter efflux pump n=1 Tax=Cellulomonas fimi (strain ATCC 484 / DSM 20113 / JCM 1341 / CCUG 24087 / LMG 16345 / NBRC 15513 / NCIMB 8980 / NCTC 7547 / NRS-133) TaxID=590998 RepID=F4H300_CELFA|nr:anibiotic ABC transporter [Cellulomonas fimi]AEE47618.1 anibiotic ABC transporter efflux pump [Cellulomonas fimi ATCC 484]NNH08611.1 anibiotic ABC transporter [Cellulomonas fimi]VEH36656.1 Uncharacterised protein [Cellulomonas fimi]